VKKGTKAIIKFIKFKINNKLKLKKKPGNNSVHLLPICYKNLVILSGNFCSSGTNLIGRKLKKKTRWKLTTNVAIFEGNQLFGRGKYKP
jgi:hypothetical protein